MALALGEYYVSWYEGSRKRMDPVGSYSEGALAALNKKYLELAYVAAGGEAKKNKSGPTGNDHEKVVSIKVKEYLADSNDRQGKSGYGLAVRTPSEDLQIPAAQPRGDRFAFKRFQVQIIHPSVKSAQFKAP